MEIAETLLSKISKITKLTTTLDNTPGINVGGMLVQQEILTKITK
jgi:hypothetical protein